MYVTVFTECFFCFRYMMVDSADDQKTHRPAPPKEVSRPIQTSSLNVPRFKIKPGCKKKQQGRPKAGPFIEPVSQRGLAQLRCCRKRQFLAFLTTMALAPSHQIASLPVLAKILNTDNGKAAHPPTSHSAALLLLAPSISLAVWLSIHLVFISFLSRLPRS